MRSKFTTTFEALAEKTENADFLIVFGVRHWAVDGMGVHLFQHRPRCHNLRYWVDLPDNASELQFTRVASSRMWCAS